MNTLIIVDCEAPFGVGSPSVGDMTEFGAVDFNAFQNGHILTFHGKDHTKETFDQFFNWLIMRKNGGKLTFVSDNPAYDFQWINFYFWKYYGQNPFGHSARRIGDFYAGMTKNWKNASRWKHLRITPHDHNPVNDALGNAEALQRILRGET